MDHKVDELIERSKATQKLMSQFTQEQVDLTHTRVDRQIYDVSGGMAVIASEGETSIETNDHMARFWLRIEFRTAIK